MTVPPMKAAVPRACCGAWPSKRVVVPKAPDLRVRDTNSEATPFVILASLFPAAVQALETPALGHTRGTVLTRAVLDQLAAANCSTRASARHHPVHAKPAVDRESAALATVPSRRDQRSRDPNAVQLAVKVRVSDSRTVR
jgi:hypothetical protein